MDRDPSRRDPDNQLRKLDTMQTPLDLAHAQMEIGDAAGLRFYERLADAELFLMLEEEASVDRARPLIFDTSDGKVALIFDREDRLADFVDTPTPFVAMSGRRIAKILAGQSIGLGLNLGVAPSSMLMPPATVDWLNEMLGAKSIVTEATPEHLLAPKGLPESLIEALDTKLANMSGVVSAAHLVGVIYQDGQRGHILAMIDVPTSAQEGVAEAISEALSFSGIEAGQLDVTFLPSHAPHLAEFDKIGLKFEIPDLILPTSLKPLAPGMDPDSPPKLR